MHLLCVQKVRQVKQLFESIELIERKGREGGTRRKFCRSEGNPILNVNCNDKFPMTS